MKNTSLKKEKIYNYKDLPHLKIPTSIRQYLRQRGNKIGLKFDIVKFKMPKSNYIQKTKVITYEHINQIEKDTSGIQKSSLKKLNLHNARCYLSDNKKDIILPKKNGLSLEEQSIIMGHHRSWLASHKSQNSLFFRYLRFIGKGNIIKSRDILNDNMSKLIDKIYTESEKFEREIYFYKLISKKYMELYGRYIQQQNVRKTIYDIYASFDCGIILYKRAKEICNIISKIDYSKLDYNIYGLYNNKEIE